MGSDRGAGEGLVGASQPAHGRSGGTELLDIGQAVEQADALASNSFGKRLTEGGRGFHSLRPGAETFRQAGEVRIPEVGGSDAAGKSPFLVHPDRAV